MEQNRRRSTDRLPASAGRIVLALIGLFGAGSGGWMVRDRVVSAAGPPTIDQAARDSAREAAANVVLLRAEMAGELRVISQKQDQLAEMFKELLAEQRRDRRAGR